MSPTARPQLPLKVRRTNSGAIIHRVHPHGWIIKKDGREPESRVGVVQGHADHFGPMTWYEVTRLADKPKWNGVRLPKRSKTFDTLRTARAWCDEHKEWPDG